MRQLAGISLPAKLSNLGELKGVIRDQLVHLGYPDDRCLQIELACDEIITNVISYAYPGAEGWLTVACQVHDLETFSVTIVDQGIAYNPLEVEPPDLSLDIAERKIGGLGVFFVREVAEDIVYSRESSSNILVLTFKKFVNEGTYQ